MVSSTQFFAKSIYTFIITSLLATYVTNLDLFRLKLFHEKCKFEAPHFTVVSVLLFSLSLPHVIVIIYSQKSSTNDMLYTIIRNLQNPHYMFFH
jgi:hypothetical protein